MTAANVALNTAQAFFVGYVNTTLSFGTAGAGIPLYVVSDANGNYNPGTNAWTCPASGWYRVTASVGIQATGQSGALPAGSYVGLQFEAGVAPTYEQRLPTGPGANVVKYENVVPMNAGEARVLSIGTSSGTDVVEIVPGNGFICIERVG